MTDLSFWSFATLCNLTCTKLIEQKNNEPHTFENN